MSRRYMAAVLIAAIALTGCGGSTEPVSSQTAANTKSCGGDECHQETINAHAAGAHGHTPCDMCHAGTGADHAADPKAAVATIDWTIDACAECHQPEAATYLYDDNAQPGPFGGSQRRPPQPKADVFPEYKTIVAGHAFAKDYNEEGAHAYLLEDHYETTRGKFETCVQCKSTKVALAWDSGKPIRVSKDTTVTLTHTAVAAAPGIKAQPAKSVTIPAGTAVTYETDPATRRVDARATFPDGTVWTSQPKPSDDTTANYNMLWASSIAAAKDTWPYGAGCNHCHDPHTGDERLVRKAMLSAIEGDGGLKGTGGVNPYVEGSTKDWRTASARDRRNLMCTQCHVEYTCGKSGVDGVDRDAFGWAKATDLHDLYSAKFGYTQDWKNAIMGEPLIKNQHPEAELYWNSVHYDAGASCVDCHMPEVSDGSRTFRSHWFTSPYKYGDEELRRAFARTTGVTMSARDNPCSRCHDDRTAQGQDQQRAFFAQQAVVEKLLARSVTAFGTLRDAKASGRGVNEGAYASALEAHRRAHVIWENLAVSENSMGFHNFAEATASMREAEKQVRIALQEEKKALR